MAAGRLALTKAMRHTIYGALFAPILAAVLLTVPGWLEYGDNIAFGPLGSFLISLLSCSVAEIVLGVPMLILGFRTRMIRWWTAMLAGAATGVVTATVINLPYQPLPTNLVRDGAVGALAGLGFWLVWRRGSASSFSPPR